MSFVIGHWSFADVYLRDVPEGHYAYNAVYDLIRQGITNGFPDGTFRGKQLMSRYEIAAFIAKFVQSKNLARGANEKLVEELKSEIYLINFSGAQANKETQCFGELEGWWRRGAAAGLSGGQAAYRLKTGLAKNFGDISFLKINLDTMDSGFNGTQRDLATEMLDIAGQLKWGPTAITITSGPGEIKHTDAGLFPAENNSFFRRPWRSLSFSTSTGRSDFSLDFISRSADSTGTVGVSEVSGKLAQNFSPLKLTLNPRIFSDQAGGRDIRGEVSAEYKSIVSFLLGVGKATDFPHNLYVRGDLVLADVLRLTAQRLGSEYRERMTYNIFDLFDRNLPDGSASVGAEINKTFGRWFIELKGDYTQPGSISTGQIRLGAGPYALVYQLYKTQTLAQAIGLAVDIRF